MSLGKLIVTGVIFVVVLTAYILQQRNDPQAPSTVNLDQREPTRAELDLEAPAEDEEPIGESRKQPFRSLELANLQSASIELSGAEKTATRTGSSFSLSGTSLSQGSYADVEILGSLVSDIAQITLAKAVRRVESSEELAEFGLDRPAIEVTLTHSAEKKASDEVESSAAEADETNYTVSVVRFGNEHPVTKRRYFSYGTGPEVYSVDTFYYDSLSKHFLELEDLSLLSFNPSWVTMIAVEIAPSMQPLADSAARYKIARHSFENSDASNWLVESEAEEYPAEASYVERKLASLATLEGELVENEGGAAAEDEILTLVLVLNRVNSRGHPAMRVTISRDPEKGYFLLHNQDEKKSYRVFGGQYKDFLQGPRQFRIRHPFLLDAAGITTLSEGRWREKAINVDYAVREDLAQLEVLSYLPLADSTQFESPTVSFAIMTPAGALELTVGARLSSASDSSEDSGVASEGTATPNPEAPAYFRVSAESGPSYQAVISAFEVERLTRLATKLLDPQPTS